MNKFTIFLLVAILVIYTGVASAQSSDIKYSFEENETINWNVLNEGAGPIDRNSSQHTDGFYSLEWRDSGSSIERSFMRTRDVGFVNPEYTHISFGWKMQTSVVERDAFELKLITPEQIIVIYGVDGVQDNQFIGGANVNNVQGNRPSTNQWHNVTIEIEDTSIVTHIDNQTLTTNMTQPIQNPNDVKLALEFSQSAFDSDGTVVFIDNIVIDTSPTGLTAFQTPDILVFSLILFLTLYAGVRLRSPATITFFGLLGLATVGVIWLDLPLRIFWALVVISFSIIIVSAFVYFKN